MREISSLEGLNIVLNINDCAHQCLYCYFDNHKNSRVAFPRFLSIIERFIDWKEARGLKNFDIPFTLFHCDDYDLDTLRKMVQLAARLGRYRTLYLDGLRRRSEKEMRKWLLDRQSLGIRTVIVSFLGHGTVHDYWNGRPGDFDFLISTLKIAAELGMEMVQRLHLLKSTLPCLEELINKLDALPGKVKRRSIEPISYSGRADNLEAERVTAADLEFLPERVAKFFTKRKNWHSEREWIEIVSKKKTSPADIVLKLWVDDSNIDRIESMSCDEIIAELESRTRAAFAALPTRLELCKECGDLTNLRLYAGSQDVERKWLNQYLAKHNIRFERQLTYLTMFNRS